MTELDTPPPPTRAEDSPARWTPGQRGLFYALAALVLALVFALYTQPDMMVTVAEQLWACF